MNTGTRFTPLPSYLIRLTHLTLFFLDFYVLLAIFPLASALQTVSIASNDPSIHYQPSQGVWNSVGDSGATNGAFWLARTQDGVAQITKNFRSLHYASPLWPFPIHVQISIDDITQIIDLQDYSVPATKAPATGLEHATKPSQVRWSFHDVDKERTVKLSAADSSDTGWIAVVDSLIFEVAEPADPPVTMDFPPPPTDLSNTPATGSDSTNSTSVPPTSSDSSLGLGSSIQTAATPLSTGVDNSLTPSSGSDSNKDHQAEKRSGERRILIMSCSVSASILLLMLGGAIMWGLKKQRDRNRRVTTILEEQWRYGGGLNGNCDEKEYTRYEKATIGPATPQMVATFGPNTIPQGISKVHAAPSVPSVLAPTHIQTRPKSPGKDIPPETSLDSYIHPHYTPNASDDASFSTFSATSRSSMDHAATGLGVIYGVDQGVGVRGRGGSRSGVGRVGHGSTSSMSSLGSADSSSYLMSHSSRASHLTQGVIRHAERVHLQERDSRFLLSGNPHGDWENARASVDTLMARISIPAPSKSTSNNATPSSEFGSAQWHEVVGGFPAPPSSARIVCPQRRMASKDEGDHDLVGGHGVGTGDGAGRRESCWSESFPFPIPRIPLPGLPYIPGSASATQVSFDSNSECFAGRSPVAHGAATASHPSHFPQSRSQPSTPVPKLSPLRPLPSFTSKASSPKLSPQPPGCNACSTVPTTTNMKDFELFIHPHLTDGVSLGSAGIPTPPPSRSDGKFAFGLGAERGVNRAPYVPRSPFTSSLDTLGKLEAELDA